VRLQLGLRAPARTGRGVRWPAQAGTSVLARSKDRVTYRLTPRAHGERASPIAPNSRRGAGRSFLIATRTAAVTRTVVYADGRAAMFESSRWRPERQRPVLRRWRVRAGAPARRVSSRRSSIAKRALDKQMRQHVLRQSAGNRCLLTIRLNKPAAASHTVNSLRRFRGGG
jgi:hypothetical protein